MYFHENVIILVSLGERCILMKVVKVLLFGSCLRSNAGFDF